MSSNSGSVHEHEQKSEPPKTVDESNYQQQHKPSSAFNSREEYLEHELQIMGPKRWRPNWPFKDYRFELEDSIPAMAATIGKVVMVGAIATTFATSLGLEESYIRKCAL